MANVQDRGPPSTAAVALGSAIVSLVAGYFLGQAASIGVFGRSTAAWQKRGERRRKQHCEKEDDDDGSDFDDVDSDDEVEEDDDGGHTGAKGKRDNLIRDDDDDDDDDDDPAEECKLILVVRTDLGMGKGKIAAQCSHATLACYKAMRSSRAPVRWTRTLRRWEAGGQAKVAVKVDDEETLAVLHAQALSLGLCARVIHDAGRTQIAAGSATVLGVGPAPKSRVDAVTRSLKLL